ncbi:hypothetical protein GGI15_003875 [Coemansia interrupta]|uniref:N-acetyltransferase domain-containing protein n=1 Tax=Coemansia interrupta TaxID=1126814 RepID=A0A9W8LGF1_9FUNG|nr:hypothetical protein GGI15_003875 [Coemansia interrupta]
MLVSFVAHPAPRPGKDSPSLLTRSDYESLVPMCQQIERRVFPKSEAMDIAKELRKPNQFLFVVLDLDPSPATPKQAGMQLIAYGVLAIGKIDGIARISKVCTDPRHRGQGAGEMVVNSMLRALGITKLQLVNTNPSSYSHIRAIAHAGISTIQLHVDKHRTEAVRLYARCGFSASAEIADYYAEGRDALLMTAHQSPQL